jgi:NADH dehydrogenase
VKKRVIIVGGGFGGVKTALELCRTRSVNVTLVSDRPDFRYYPALYRYAVGHSHLEASLSLGDLLSGTNVDLFIDSLIDVKPDAKEIFLKSGSKLKYDYLVLALGNITNYFGIEGLDKYSFGMKSIEEANKLRHHLHQQLIDEGKTDQHYVVVGGGPTGIEMAAALSGYLKQIVKQHDIKKPSYKIDLIEAATRLLPTMPERISKAVCRRLKRLGVEIHTGMAVEAETETGLTFKGEQMQTRTVIWTAGVMPSPFYKQHQGMFELDKRGRVVVDEHMQTHDGIFVIGDNAGTPYSGLAQTALVDAKFVAKEIKLALKHQPIPAYKPQKPIPVIPVGTDWAVMQWGSLQLWGRPIWWVRRIADLEAYFGIERPMPAIRSWLADFQREEDCPICE